MKNSSSFFRALYYRFYKGNTYHCNICKKGLRKFVDASSNEKICPNCLSTSYDRSLWSLLTSEYIDDQDQILHLCPTITLKRKFENIPNIYYISSDYLKDFKTDSENISPLKTILNQNFNLVILSKTSEYNNDIEETLKEIHRVLIPGGLCIIQTKLQITAKKPKSGSEDTAVKPIHISELTNKTALAGFDSELFHIESKSNNRAGLRVEEYFISARKI